MTILTPDPKRKYTLALQQTKQHLKAYNKMFTSDAKKKKNLALSEDEMTFKQRLTIKCSPQTKKNAHTSTGNI
jgi:hypothetical protein